MKNYFVKFDIANPSTTTNLVLYWPLYKAQLMLHSPIEVNNCDLIYSFKLVRLTRTFPL